MQFGCVQRILKLALDSNYYTSERFGEGTGPILIDYIHCTGSELEIWGQCSHFTHYYGCSHNDDVGVQCHPGQLCAQTKLQLAFNLL